jgi:hypothetical protein
MSAAEPKPNQIYREIDGSFAPLMSAVEVGFALPENLPAIRLEIVVAPHVGHIS